MDLLVEDGSMIIVDPGDRQFFHKRYYAVQNGEGETTFKQYLGDPARLVPCSSNPAHKEIILGEEPITIIGRIIWRSSRM
jgi:phage repressor protein C with HTH and peptisase S24 domain